MGSQPLRPELSERISVALGLRPSTCQANRPVSGRGQGRQPPKAGARSASLEAGRSPVYFRPQLLSSAAERDEANHDFRENEIELFLRAHLERAISLRRLTKFDFWAGPFRTKIGTYSETQEGNNGIRVARRAVALHSALEARSEPTCRTALSSTQGNTSDVMTKGPARPCTHKSGPLCQARLMSACPPIAA
jgi:hypothetical protein